MYANAINNTLKIIHIHTLRTYIHGERQNLHHALVRARAIMGKPTHSMGIKEHILQERTCITHWSVGGRSCGTWAQQSCISCT